jgi:hypothetical protein
MANFVFTVITDLLAKGQLDLREAGSDLRLILLGGTSTVGTQPDVTTLAGFTTLGEVTGTGYSRKVLANQTVTKNNISNSADCDCDDVVYDALSAGTLVGALIYLHVTNDTDSVPLVFMDQGFPMITNGGPITLRVNTSGFLQIVSPDAP